MFSFYQYKFDFSYQGGVVDQIVSNRIYTAQIQNLVIKWERKNQLMMPRRNHNSIRYARDLLFHVGGQNRMYEFYPSVIYWVFYKQFKTNITLGTRIPRIWICNQKWIVAVFGQLYWSKPFSCWFQWMFRIEA